MPVSPQSAAIAATVGANVTLSVLFILVWPSVNLRVASSNGIIPVVMIAFAWVLMRHAPPRMLALARLMAAVALLMSALAFVRAMIALAGPPIETPLGFSLINVLVYFGAAMGQLAVGLSCYVMLMTRRTVALQALTTTDPLTGAVNRRGLDVVIARVEHDFLRHGTPYSLIVADLDHFKRVNDAYGHAAGDAVLKRFASLCRDDLRGDSVLARVGGGGVAESNTSPAITKASVCVSRIVRRRKSRKRRCSSVRSRSPSALPRCQSAV